MIGIIEQTMNSLAFVPAGSITSINVTWPSGSGTLAVTFYLTCTGDVTHYEFVIDGTSYGQIAAGAGSYTKTVNKTIPGPYSLVTRIYYNGTQLDVKSSSGNLPAY